MSARMSLEEYRLLKQKPKRNKYGAKPIRAYGIYFPSTVEKEFHDFCILRKQCGELSYFLTHVPLHLPSGNKLIIDKVLFYTVGLIEFIDVKGTMTRDFLIKKKEIEFYYPFQIKIARKRKDRWEIN